MDRKDLLLDPGCPFCDPQKRAQAVAEYGTVFAINDISPVTPGHLLVIPKRHTPNFFTMTPEERSDTGELLKILCDLTTEADSTILGFNIGSNCGEAAGQSVMHAHVHLIPRRQGDKPNWGIRRDIAKVHS